MDGIQLDVIRGNEAYGELAKRLVACGKNPRKLRDNDVLRKETFLEFDKIAIEESLLRLNIVADMIAAGMEYNLRSVGISKTVLQWETHSDIGPAEITMDAISNSDADQALYDHSNLLPLYITHKDIFFSKREVMASAEYGEPLDVSNLRLASRKVAEATESMAMIGPSGFARQIQLPTVWGNTAAFGFLNAPHAHVSTTGVNWLTDTTANIVAEVIAMKQTLINDRHFGPYNLYLPTAYETVLDKDYSTATNTVTTLRQRLQQIGNIAKIGISDWITQSASKNRTLMVQMDSSVADMVMCLDPIVIPWETHGGMRLNYKVMSCMVPRQKATFAARSGVFVMRAT